MGVVSIYTTFPDEGTGYEYCRKVLSDRPLSQATNLLWLDRCIRTGHADVRILTAHISARAGGPVKTEGEYEATIHEGWGAYRILDPRTGDELDLNATPAQLGHAICLEVRLERKEAA